MDEGVTAAALNAKRAELVDELRLLTERPKDAMPSVSYGKRIGDGTTEAVERINQTAAARSISLSLRGVERALQKLSEGTYGRCDGCGTLIPKERLEAIPSTSLCVSCSANRPRPAA